MEKTKPSILAKQKSESRNHVIWDCGSSLYDLFELKAFEKQLDAAMTSRSLSMPHLSGRRLPPPPPPPLNKKPASKISRSFHKLIRAVFGPKSSSSITKKDGDFGGGFGYERSKEGLYVVHDRSPVLPTIPEVPELSPEMRRAASERFAANWIGVSCS